ncbi:MAG: hypothetical protein RLZZ241_80 [Bacteroidota bacterium]
MKYLLRLFLTSIAVTLLAYLLPGISVDSFTTALLVALVLSLLNVFIKPVLVFLTLPATLISLGLFLLVINSTLILISSYLISGFRVSGFWSALLFSILLSILQSVLFTLSRETEA